MKKSLLILIAILSLSCEKEPLNYPNMEVIVYYPDTPNTYLWSDLSNPNMGWEEIENGNAGFTITSDRDSIRIYTDKPVINTWILKEGKYKQTDLNNTFLITGSEMTFRFEF